METILTIAYAGNVVFGIYILFLMSRLQKSILNGMRIFAAIWGVFASIAYILMGYIFHLLIDNKSICIPYNVNISIQYWQLSIALAIMFTLLIMFLSIKKGIYGPNKCN